ncbi:hypothetical protein MTBUT4_70118 [Magnetospirillum sp. UT-4]|nr:hypothetical protein MTBUT4_70118 [Magnetospirillum sp. UT-4]
MPYSGRQRPSPDGEAPPTRRTGRTGVHRNRVAAPEGRPGLDWWAVRGSNPRPSRCKRDALPLS